MLGDVSHRRGQSYLGAYHDRRLFWRLAFEDRYVSCLPAGFANVKGANKKRKKEKALQAVLAVGTGDTKLPR